MSARKREALADEQDPFDTFARDSAIQDATASLTRQVIEAEVERLGVAATTPGEPH